MPKKLVVPYNEFSGAGKFLIYKNSIKDIFNKYGWTVIFEPLFIKVKNKFQDGKAILEAHPDADMIMSYGGDGTFSNIAGSIVETANWDLPIAHLPGGTANDLYKLHGFSSSDVLTVAQEIAEGHAHKIDVLMINDNPCLYTAAFGFPASISYETPRHLKRILGKKAYYLKTIMNMYQFLKKYELSYEVNGIKKEGKYILGAVSNSTGFGSIPNIYECPILNDGIFEVTFLRTFDDVNKIFTEVVLGHKPIELVPGIETYKTDKLVINTDNPPTFSFDGEKSPRLRSPIVVVPAKKTNYNSIFQ